MNAKGYFDLCVPVKHFFDEKCLSTLEFLYKSGYRTIAINQEVDENTYSNQVNRKKKKKGDESNNSEIVPEPIKIHEYILNEFQEMTVLNRLTIIFSNQEYFNKLSKSTNLKKFDILAVMPKTKVACTYICKSVEADIIAYDAEEKLSYRMDRGIYFKLIKKGFFFEVLYGPAIEDQTKRDNIISISHMYHGIGKSRNVIISSGASKLIHMRSAYDAINLGLIFGLNSQQSKDAIQHCGAELCKKAVGRCHGKSIVMVENLSIQEIEESDGEEMEVDLPAPKRKKTDEDSIIEIL